MSARRIASALGAFVGTLVFIAALSARVARAERLAKRSPRRARRSCR